MNNHVKMTFSITVPQNFAVTLNGSILRARWDAPPDQTISSYTLTCSVDDNEVLSLETSLLNVTLGVYMTAATYTCNVYATTTNGDGTPTDNVSVTTGGITIRYLCDILVVCLLHPRFQCEGLFTIHPPTI